MILQNLAWLVLPLAVFAKDDYYFRACNKLIMKNKAYAKIGAMEPTEMYMDLQQNIDYQDSLADCIVSCSNLTNETMAKQEYIQKVSWGYFRYMCDFYNVPPATKWDVVASRIEENPVVANPSDNSTLRVKIPTERLKQDNIIPGGLSFYRARRYPVTMGYGLIYYVVGIFGIQMIINLLNQVFPRLVAFFLQLPVIRNIRRYFTLAPLFGTKTSKVFNNYNQRLHYLWIAGFVVLNILFACLGYDGQVTSPLYYADKTHLYSSAIGFRTGYLAMYPLPIAFLFATRNNILMYLTGWNLDVFNLWHRWIGRLCFLQAVAHSAAYYIHYHATNTVHIQWKEAYWYWGFIATLFLGIMCVQGSKTIRSLAYDLFVIVHIILAALVLVGLYVHLWYTNQCKEVWYVCVAFWGADHLFRIVRIILNGGIITSEVSGPTSESIVLKIPHSNLIKSTHGSFVFVHLLHPLLFWQSHPFTIVPEEGSKGIKLILKHRNGLTKWLLKQVAKGQIKVMIDGPYATPINFKQFDTLSFVAGGIGVTAAYSHLMSLSKEEISSKSVSFDWVVRSERSTYYFKEEIEKLRSLPIDFKIHVKENAGDTATQPSESSQSSAEGEAKDLDDKETNIIHIRSADNGTKRPSLLQTIMLPKISLCEKSLAFFVCGPSTLNREARQVIADQAVISSKYIQHFDESFSM